jgi:hypothetical protein
VEARPLAATPIAAAHTDPEGAAEVAGQEDDPLDGHEIQRAASELGAAHAKSQSDYDDSIRTIAAGAVAVTASLVAALHVAAWSGGLAIGLSVAALTATLLSHWTSQFGSDARMKLVFAANREGIRSGPWESVTTTLNAVAGLCVVTAGVALLVFVTTHT